MTRYKKYLQAKSIKLENDYPWMPFEIDHQGVCIDTVTPYVDDTGVGVVEYYNVIIGWIHFDRHGNKTWGTRD